MPKSKGAKQCDFGGFGDEVFAYGVRVFKNEQKRLDGISCRVKRALSRLTCLFNRGLSKRGTSLRHAISLLFLLCLPIVHLSAGSVVIGGLISQSTLDGTGPASSNPSLNNIQDLQAYTLTRSLQT